MYITFHLTCHLKFAEQTFQVRDVIQFWVPCEMYVTEERAI
jgi:hypothetical protein